MAGLVGLDQGIWPQWSNGTTKILDKYWLIFAIELNFDPFKTRPYLLDLLDLISTARGSDTAVLSKREMHLLSNFRKNSTTRQNAVEEVLDIGALDNSDKNSPSKASLGRKVS